MRIRKWKTVITERGVMEADMTESVIMEVAKMELGITGKTGINKYLSEAHETPLQ